MPHLYHTLSFSFVDFQNLASFPSSNRIEPATWFTANIFRCLSFQPRWSLREHEAFAPRSSWTYNQSSGNPSVSSTATSNGTGWRRYALSESVSLENNVVPTTASNISMHRCPNDFRLTPNSSSSWTMLRGTFSFRRWRRSCRRETTQDACQYRQSHSEKEKRKMTCFSFD